METSWNLEELREFVRKNWNSEQYLLDLISSIDRGITIFRYHFFTAKKSMSEYFDADAKPRIEHLRLVLGASENHEYQSAKISNQANTIAAIYTTRSLFDIFAQLVRALLLRDELTEQDCNIRKVEQRLKDGNLKECINKILISKGFLYVNAFANVSKHRYNIKHGTS
ncbi:hypothetical protein [Thiorhodococcus drewsii]|uniref:hypothetical protein n=1 Tax=Thiorhodococcus drewsii TaxID=210408 RepID=UPI000593FFBE|nr:hypothetical protein [Thiorhodococcus drewsii]